jgi:hypothetical protein
MKCRLLLTMLMTVAVLPGVASSSAHARQKKSESQRHTLETRREELRNVRRNPDRLEMQKRLKFYMEKEGGDEQIKLAGIYGEQMQKMLWDERELRAELNLLYAALLEYAEANEGRLPQSTGDLPPIEDLDVAKYHYFPVAGTDELSDQIVLVIPPAAVAFEDGDHVYVSDGNLLRRVSTSEYRELVREQGTNGKWSLARHMRQMEPRLPVLMGDGTIVNLLKTSYEGVVEKNNESRRTLGYGPIPIGLLHRIFAPVEAGIFLPYRKNKRPRTDKYGLEIGF